MNVPRRTPSAPATLTGRGLFSGRPATVAIRPAPPGSGITLKRTDLPDAPPVEAVVGNIDSRAVHPAFERLPPRCTTLAPPRRPDASIATVEHLLSALAGLGITDAAVEIDGPELPIADGAASFLTETLLAASITTLWSTIDAIAIREPIIVTDSAGGRIEAVPADQTHFIYHLDYGPSSPIAPQSAEWSGDPDDYAARIAPARTFCLEAEARAMHALGLFQALSPRELLVFGSNGPIDNTLRFPDEPARHKLLDLIGDLSLAGRPIRARITATRSGHALNHEMARRLAALRRDSADPAEAARSS